MRFLKKVHLPQIKASIQKLSPFPFFKRAEKPHLASDAQPPAPATAKAYPDGPAGLVEKASDLEKANDYVGAVSALSEAITHVQRASAAFMASQKSPFVNRTWVVFLEGMGYEVEKYYGVAGILLSVPDASNMMNKKIAEYCDKAAGICGKDALERAERKDFAGAAESYSSQGRILLYGVTHTRGYASFGLGDSLLCKAVVAFSNEASALEDAAKSSSGIVQADFYADRDRAIGKLRTAYELIGIPFLIKEDAELAHSKWRFCDGTRVSEAEILAPTSAVV